MFNFSSAEVQVLRAFQRKVNLWKIIKGFIGTVTKTTSRKRLRFNLLNILFNLIKHTKKLLCYW